MTDPVVVGIFSLTGAAVGFAAQAFAQAFGQRHQRLRERTAELRRAQSEFAATSFSYLVTMEMKANDYDPTNLDAIKKQLKQAMRQLRMGERLHERAYRAMLLEADTRHRKALASLLMEITAAGRDKREKSPQESIGDAHLALMVWVETQAQRADL